MTSCAIENVVGLAATLATLMNASYIGSIALYENPAGAHMRATHR